MSAIQPATASQRDGDLALAALRERKDEWARLPVGKKLRYLLEMRRQTAAVAEDWVAAAVAAKGIPDGSPLAGEEWISGPWALLFALNRLMETLSAIARDGTPRLRQRSVRTRATGRHANGQVVVDVFPQSLYDRLLVGGVSAEVWMRPEVAPETLVETMGVLYRGAPRSGKTSLVLGAGNIASIPPLDVLYKLYSEGHVCLLKLNPLNDFLGPFFQRIFAGLIADGYVRIVSGGADLGDYLCRHADVDAIHVTGSMKTHDAIVFGAGEEGAARKRRNEPINSRPITSELGNVSPTIVVPGPWSPADLRFQAEHIATQKLHNGGFNCVAAQVLILPERWNLTPALLARVRAIMRDAPPRAAYYPGAAQRQRALADGHPTSEALGPEGDRGRRTLIPGLDACKRDDACFTTEAFAAVLGATTLPGANAVAFLRGAVNFCNETLWGTLGANIIVHPATIEELGPALDDAIAELRYGCVAVNAWTGVGFLLPQVAWGAYPGHTRDDVGSGIGIVHNSLLFDKPQKSVVRGPFYPFPRGLLHGQLSLLPRPTWFITHGRADRVGRRLVRFEADPGIRHLPGIFADALRG